MGVSAGAQVKNRLAPQLPSPSGLATPAGEAAAKTGSGRDGHGKGRDRFQGVIRQGRRRFCRKPFEYGGDDCPVRLEHECVEANKGRAEATTTTRTTQYKRMSTSNASSDALIMETNVAA